VKSVDPVNAIDASGYVVFRSEKPGGAAQKIADGLAKPEYHDTSVERGGLYFYTVKASNKVGTSAPSAELGANAALPGPWRSRDIGDVQVSGFTEYNGERFMLEGEGVDINGTSDSFHFAYAKYSGRDDARVAQRRFSARLGVAAASLERRARDAHRDRRRNHHTRRTASRRGAHH